MPSISPRTVHLYTGAEPASALFRALSFGALGSDRVSCDGFSTTVLFLRTPCTQSLAFAKSCINTPVNWTAREGKKE